MAETLVTQLDVQSWLRKARRQPDPAAWLDNLNDQATNAVAAHDEYVSMTSDEGGSATSERGVNARFLQHVTEQCLQILEAEAAAEAAGNTLPPPHAVRYASFS